MTLIATLRGRARRLKTEVHALYLAARHPSTPWYAKLFLIAIVAYALSPIDLIPDFIPIIGLLDEIILLPFAIVFALKMVPAAVMAECRVRASEQQVHASRLGRMAAIAIVLLWLALIVLVTMIALKHIVPLSDTSRLNELTQLFVCFAELADRRVD